LKCACSFSFSIFPLTFRIASHITSLQPTQSCDFIFHRGPWHQITHCISQRQSSCCLAMIHHRSSSVMLHKLQTKNAHGTCTPAGTLHICGLSPSPHSTCHIILLYPCSLPCMCCSYFCRSPPLTFLCLLSPLPLLPFFPHSLIYNYPLLSLSPAFTLLPLPRYMSLLATCLLPFLFTLSHSLCKKHTTPRT
jgi:hypothetical protein